jgi:predicted metal-dependent hydrolase
VAVAAVVEAAAADSVENPERLPGLALRGIEEFNRGEFYECHEYLEEAWMQEPGRVRFLYQGILQVGVGFYHLQNGNWRGATGLLRGGSMRLKEFEPETLGVDVAKLVRECESCLKELESLGRARVGEFDTSKIPKVAWI